MTSDSVDHITLTLSQPVESGWSEWGSNSRPSHQESRALPTKQPRPWIMNLVRNRLRKCCIATVIPSIRLLAFTKWTKLNQLLGMKTALKTLPSKNYTTTECKAKSQTFFRTTVHLFNISTPVKIAVLCNLTNFSFLSSFVYINVTLT